MRCLFKVVWQLFSCHHQPSLFVIANEAWQSRAPPRDCFGCFVSLAMTDGSVILGKIVREGLVASQSLSPSGVFWTSASPPCRLYSRRQQDCYGFLLGRSSVDCYGAHSHSGRQPSPHYWLQAGMFSYKLGHWRAGPVIEAYQTLSQRPLV